MATPLQIAYRARQRAAKEARKEARDLVKSFNAINSVPLRTTSRLSDGSQRTEFSRDRVRNETLSKSRQPYKGA